MTSLKTLAAGRPLRSGGGLQPPYGGFGAVGSGADDDDVPAAFPRSLRRWVGTACSFLPGLGSSFTVLPVPGVAVVSSSSLVVLGWMWPLHRAAARVEARPSLAPLGLWNIA